MITEVPLRGIRGFDDHKQMSSTAFTQEELPNTEYSHEQPALDPIPPPEPDDGFSADEEAAAFLHGGASASSEPPPLLLPTEEPPPATVEPTCPEQRLHELHTIAQQPSLDGRAVASILGELEKVPMTYEVLVASGFGHVLKRWSLSNPDDAAKARAKALVDQWRGLCTTPGSFGKCFLLPTPRRTPMAST